MANAMRTGDWIDNSPIREAVLEAIGEGLTWNELALRMGKARNGGGGEATAIKRRLGLAREKSHGTSRLTRTIHYDIAVRICRAIDRDPFELDL